jgi:hypothetical protein
MGTSFNSETVQAGFTEWYDSPARRIKYNASSAAVGWWLATGSNGLRPPQMQYPTPKGTAITTAGAVIINANAPDLNSSTYSYAPAFCIGGAAE